MNYPPKHHQETDFKNIVETIKKYPLATLISAKDSKVFTTHVPLIYSASGGEFGTLIGHIDKFNPHIDLLQEHIPAQAIFHGPQLLYFSERIQHATISHMELRQSAYFGESHTHSCE